LGFGHVNDITFLINSITLSFQGKVILKPIDRIDISASEAYMDVIAGCRTKISTLKNNKSIL
jgi:hypothetical protein